MDQWVEAVIFSAFASPKGREMALESPFEENRWIKSHSNLLTLAARLSKPARALRTPLGRVSPLAKFTENK
jgi:hypothetical protein